MMLAVFRSKYCVHVLVQLLFPFVSPSSLAQATTRLAATIALWSPGTLVGGRVGVSTLPVSRVRVGVSTPPVSRVRVGVSTLPVSCDLSRKARYSLSRLFGNNALHPCPPVAQKESKIDFERFSYFAHGIRRRCA